LGGAVACCRVAEDEDIAVKNVLLSSTLALVFALNACAQRGSDSETSALGQQKKAAPNVSNQVYRNLNVIELRKKRIDIGDFAAKAEAEARRVLQSSKEDNDLRKGARELLNELGNDVKKPIIFGKITKADAYFLTIQKIFLVLMLK
jgi:hypothetical protein